MKESAETITSKEADDIINHIVTVCELEPKNEDDEVFSLDLIRDLLSLYKGSSKDHAARILSTWKFSQAIQSDSVKEGKYEHYMSKKELKKIITGKYLKEEMLFDSYSLNIKRENVEEYSKLFLLLGGSEKGLSKDALKKCLATADAFANNPKETLKGEISIDTNPFTKEAEEILKIMGSDQDNITIKDFVNIMTMSMAFPDQDRLNSLKFKGDN